MRKWILIVLIIIIGGAATTYKSNFFEIAKQIEIFTDAYKQINLDYVDEVNPAELMDVAITSMFAHLDPYTNFWNEQQVKESRLLRSGNYTGIGANIENRNQAILIKEVFEDSPADRAGLKAGDEITKIGETLVSDFHDDAGELLKGTPGTEVHLTFKRRGEIKTTNLKRENVRQKLVPFYNLVENDIGYIRLTEFGRTASTEVADALKTLKAQGAKKIILDLRGNPGGLLTEAVHISNLFLPKDQLIVSTQSIVEKYNQTYLTQREPIDLDMPVAVLINAHSASASEIVAGSMQDLDRGVVVGAQSFGKGLVQRVRPLKYGSQMKLTISRYYTPSGRCIQALDYGHRDEDGNTLRAKIKDYKAFKTKQGTAVYDAGGVIPDIQLESSDISGITQALINEHIIFDFATEYYYQNQLKDVKSFKFSDSDFKDFKKYLQKTDFKYETEFEKNIKKAFADAAEDDLKNKIQPEFEKFLKNITELTSAEVEKNKVQIIQQLSDEILKRYLYESGFYDYSLKHNPEIQEAIRVLKNNKEYNQILSKK